MVERVRRNYTNATVAALMTLARGGCYVPRCGAPTIRMIDGQPVVNLDIAHIRALKPDGKRYDSAWTVEQRNSFANLLLLCNVHHKRIDGAGGERYTVTVLEAWKRKREADGQEALAGLSGVTEAKLTAMIHEAQESYIEQIQPVLDAVAKQMPQLSSLMKVLKSDLEKQRGRGGQAVSEDTAWMIYQASRDLAHLQDTAPWLEQASSELSHLRDTAPRLSDAADDLVGLEDRISMLRAAAAELKRAADMATNARL